jgi:acyl-CoA thioesterase-1
MNHKIKLLSFAVAVLLILLVAESIVLATMQSQNSKNNFTLVACVGDSITAGTEYPLDLWQQLGSNFIVGNFGIGGSTVSLSTNSSWINETGFSVAKQFLPNIVIIALGTNDANTAYNETNSGFITDYMTLIHEFEELTSKPKIYLMLPPPIFNNNGNLSQTYFVQNVIPSIKQVANQTGLSLIDANTPLLNHQSYFEDGVHPNVEGAHIIANTTYNVLKSASV